MSVINITKISSVVSITTDSDIPKSYFGYRGSFSPTPAGTGFNIAIGIDNFQVLRTDLRVNGQAPSTMSEASTLLRSIFGV